jgi:hypothetical protein
MSNLMWARYEDVHVAQGNGKRWKVVEHTAPEGEQGPRYTLWARSLKGGEYEPVAVDCKSLQEAKGAAE